MNYLISFNSVCKSAQARLYWQVPQPASALPPATDTCPHGGLGKPRVCNNSLCPSGLCNSNGPLAWPHYLLLPPQLTGGKLPPSNYPSLTEIGLWPVFPD